MRLLFSGSSSCDFTTLKRLILLGDEIAFMDNPWVIFDDWVVSMGKRSRFRDYRIIDSVVNLLVLPPPSASEADLYVPYIEADLESLEFRNVFLEGLKVNNRFVSECIGLKREVINALLEDVGLHTIPFEKTMESPRNWAEMHNSLGRRETLRAGLIKASLKVTAAMIVSEKNGYIPVSDDSYFSRMLALRMSQGSYLDGTSRIAVHLGINVAKAVIPDEVLNKIGVEDLLKYRRESYELYRAWSVELDRVSAQLDHIDLSLAKNDIDNLIKSEFRPELLKYENEMKSIRDRLFGNLIKVVAKWEIPTLSIAFLSDLNATKAIAAFVGALAPSVPHLVDYIQARRETKRKYGLAYLIGLSKKTKPIG